MKMLSPKDILRLRWKLKKKFFRNFWITSRNFKVSIFLGFSTIFLKVWKKVFESSSKSQKCFNFHQNRRISFGDSIFTVQALFITPRLYISLFWCLLIRPRDWSNTRKRLTLVVVWWTVPVSRIRMFVDFSFEKSTLFSLCSCSLPAGWLPFSTAQTRSKTR